MLDDIEDGKINCVITKDLSRLGRNYVLTGQYTDIYFPSHNVRYIAIADGVDSSKGNPLYPVPVLWTTKELVQIYEEVKNG